MHIKNNLKRETMDILKRQELVIKKGASLKQMVGTALSLDECEEFVSSILSEECQASEKPSDCSLDVVSNNEVVVCDCDADHVCGLCFKEKGWCIKDGRFQKQTDC